MSAALRHSAYSTNIKTRNDFSCVFFDRTLRTVAQAFNQPVHLGSTAVSVPRIVEKYGPERLGPGDALLCNDPYLGSVHLNDILLVSPVFFRDTLIGYVANLAHHVDVGGGSAASIGAFRELYQEGIIIPPVRLVQAGRMVEDVFNLVLSQIRSKRETAGDFRAQVAANNTGVRRICELVEQMGLDTMEYYIDRLMDYTERRTRSELAKLPKGEFQAEGYVDYDGFSDQPVYLKARLVIGEEEIFFDLEGCDRQRKGPTNSTYAQTYSGCIYVLKCLIDPDVPVNSGLYKFMRMNAPPGTVVNSTHPYPVVGGWETQTRLIDVMINALADALPERIPAGTKAMMAQVGFGGTDPRSGELYAFYEAIAGGYGGRSGSDGPDAVQAHGQNTENAPIEEVELHYPVRIDRYCLVENSDGPGEFRGGLGVQRDYLFPDSEASFSLLSDRDRWGPAGLFGGQPGLKASYILNPDGEAITLGSKSTVHLNPGDLVSVRTCGGGGYGPPLQRDPALVLRDVRDGKVSIERARDIYGVVIDPRDWRVDERATVRLRAERGSG
jgi:N-methylhydantoinase B